jgi:hypothetical protein
MEVPRLNRQFWMLYWLLSKSSKRYVVTIFSIAFPLSVAI